MKSLFIIISFIFVSGAFCQDRQEIEDAKTYLLSKKIVLNYVPPQPGFDLYYNCDSMLFMRGDFGDTIKIWTPGAEWAYGLKEFKDLTNKPDFGITVFPKSILSDGRILVASYIQTQFIHHNDSLFELTDTVTLPMEYYDLVVKQTLGLIADTTVARKQDSIRQIHEGKHSYVPKLIYAKNMFKSGKRKVKLPKRVSYLGDEIELENEWIENSKKSFVIRINNREDGQKTSYAYALNEDLKFIWWQGCGQKTK